MVIQKSIQERLNPLRGLSFFYGLKENLTSFTQTSKNAFGREISADHYHDIKDYIPYGDYFDNLAEELDFEVQLSLPKRFPKGKILRSGPGIYNQSSQRRNNVIDADGMIRAYTFGENSLHVRTKILSTKKYRKDCKEGCFTAPSFAMRPSTAMLNSLRNIENQASLAVTSFGGKLLVSDEIQPLTLLDEDLEVASERFFGNDKQYAHQKVVDGLLHCLHLKTNMGDAGVYVKTYNEDFKQIAQSDVVSLNATCIHDWSVSSGHFAFIIPSSHIRETDALQALIGLKTIAQAVHFDEDKDAVLVLVSRETGKISHYIPLNHKMVSWHHINAFEKDGVFTLRLVANSNPTEISDEHTPFYQLMKGKDISNDLDQSTHTYKIEVDLSTGILVFTGQESSELVGLEMPTLKQDLLGNEHRYYYATAGKEFLQNRIVKADTLTGKMNAFCFSGNQYVSEALFVPAIDSRSEDDGFLVVDVHDGDERLNKLCVFDAKDISKGPIWKYTLPIPLPIAFHGTWSQD
ncbi:MAG: carotenoid oxygenase family protein [Ekhidna sp.]|nr:carotenoid oxygenase family protein [Ekhidna sp.]